MILEHFLLDLTERHVLNVFHNGCNKLILSKQATEKIDQLSYIVFRFDSV